MPNPPLLATHITIAIALTITVGVQSAEVARLRASATSFGPALRTALWSTPILALLTFITGIALIADGSRRGPWVGAGVLSTLIIALASVWLRLRRREAAGRSGLLGAVQWGVPAVSLAAAFLMADRPQNIALAFGTVLAAVAVAILAYWNASRSATA